MIIKTEGIPLFAVVLLIASSDGTVVAEASKSAHLRDLIQLGTRWHIYLDATVSDVVRFFMKGIDVVQKHEKFSQTLLDAWDSFPLAADRANPCAEESFRTFADIKNSARTVNASFVVTAFWNALLPSEYDLYLLKGNVLSGNELEYNLPTFSTVCGRINSVFVIPVVYNYTVYPYIIWHALYAYSWHILAEVSFKINITITEMSVSYLPFCTTMYAAISDVMPYNRFAMLGIHCPNYPIRSFYSSGHAARIALFTSASRMQLNMRNMIQDDSFGDFTFLYQIHDNDFSIVSRMFLQVINVKDLELGTYLGELLRKESNTDVSSGVQYDRTSFVNKNKLWSSHVLAIGTFKKVSVGMLYIQAPLGDTVSVMSGKFMCSSNLHSLKFYDGPPADMLRTDIIQQLLMLWECSTSNVRDTQIESRPVNASIGDLTILRITHTKISGFGMLTVGLRWTFITPQNDTIQLETIEIERTENRTKIFIAEGSSSFLSVTVVRAPRALSIKISLQALQHRGYAAQQCRAGGLFLFSDDQYVGGVCSNVTALYLMDHYAQRGISLGNYIHIIVKQYSYMSEISANLTFSADTCVGYFNLVPTNRFILGKLYKLTSVNVRKSQVYYDFPYYNGVRWHFVTDLDLWHTLHITRLSPACVTIQIGPLDHLPADIHYHQKDKVAAMLHFSSVGKTKYSKVSIMYQSKEDLSKFSQCRRQFRVDLDTKLEETELSAALPSATTMDEPWQGEAYNIKVGIPNPCLSLYTTFVIHVEDAKPHSTCLDEAGGFLHDVYHPMLLPGICGDVDLIAVMRFGKAFGNVMLSFQKPFPQQSCCYFDVIVQPKKTGCSNFIEVRKRLPEVLDNVVYSVVVWNIKNHTLFHGNSQIGNHTGEVFAFRVDCQVMVLYDSMNISGLETCTEIHIYVSQPDSFFWCRDIKVEFYAQDFPWNQRGSLRHKKDQREICIGSSCYVTPSILKPLAWVEADEACQQKGGVLGSINSEQEWNLLTRPHVTDNGMSSLVQTQEAQLYYIGLSMKVIKSLH